MRKVERSPVEPQEQARALTAAADAGSSYGQPSIPWDARNADRSWSALVARCPKRQRSLTRALPYRIGVADRPDGGWHHYVQFEPLYDLPSFIVNAAGVGVRRCVLDRYRRAHHISGFYGLLVDRIADAQVQLDAHLRVDRAWLRQTWGSSLVRATGKTDADRRWIAPALSRWRAAIARERVALRNGSMAASDYREIVAGKVEFLFVTGCAMMEQLDTAPTIRATVRDVFQLMLLGLQCNDDASDAAEDAARWGTATPELLGLRPSALRRAGVYVLAAAKERAQHIWPRMATWCEQLESYVARFVPPGEAILAEIGAMTVVPELIS